MRPHGRAQVDPRSPRALAICDRCQFMYNHDTLRWQFRWRGPRLQNIRLLVCESCYDTPNEQERLIVLPPDPASIDNARPENYALADNPMSPIGFNPINNFRPSSSLGQNIGILTQNAGLDAAFAQSLNKPYEFCAALSVSNSSFNWLGKNWNGDPTGITITMPSTAPIVQNTLSSFSAYAPRDAPFLRSGAASWVLQGSNDSVTWTTLSSGTTAGVAGEVLTAGTTSRTPYSFHRFAIVGDGISSVGIAALSISISNAAPNEI